MSRSMPRSLCALLLPIALASACGPFGDGARAPGQTSFLSAPPGGAAGRGGAVDASGGAGPAGAPATPSAAGTAAPRTVEETDLYRVEGDRLYTLNAYRGLMVFDLTDVDHPRLLGRSPIAGWPVEMLVRDGVASVVVADWYGALEDGSPFHGSIVRTLDARDPAHIALVGEARLGGWVRDVRVVGDVLYAVSEDWGWSYGAGDEVVSSGGTAGTGVGTANGPDLVVSSVHFGLTGVHTASDLRWSGWGGIFNVTASSILLARPLVDAASPAPRTSLQVLDISDPEGSIVKRGELIVDGQVQGWGPDNGRFNLDFADGKTARVLGCGGSWCGDLGVYVLSIADFANPDAPALLSRTAVPVSGWMPAARFDGARLFLSPNDSWSSSRGFTPIEVWDLSDPAAPKHGGSALIDGQVWSFFPAGDRLFALGNETQAGPGYGSRVSLRYLDVSDAASPQLLGTAAFGDGWAWSPAAWTFKAFARDAAAGLIALPFSGWDQTSNSYHNGVQLIEVSDRTIRAAGAGLTHGWVERGVFAKGRVLSISDETLGVIDPTDRDHPVVVSELVLARNVVSARPAGDRVALTSSDFWENDQTRSLLRVLPLAGAEETGPVQTLAELAIEGVNARTFASGDLLFVVTDVRHEAPCPTSSGGAGGPSGGQSGGPGGPSGPCFQWTQAVQVVDLAGGGARLRGRLELPLLPVGVWSGWGWSGCFWWDWFNGAEVVQTPDGHALAFRRWAPTWARGDEPPAASSALFVVDLRDPDALALGQTALQRDPWAWWGNLVAAKDRLYASHTEWVDDPQTATSPRVRTYLDVIDVSEPRTPVVRAHVNVPGVVVGGSDQDPSIVYAVDSRWDQDRVRNGLSVLHLGNPGAELIGQAQVEGWMGRVIVRGTRAWFSAERYSWSTGEGPRVGLYEADLSDPTAPQLRAAPDRKGWGWLLDVEGDAAVVTSGWGAVGVDLYRLGEGAPRFEQTVRTRGWGANAIDRQGDDLFLASGYWGVQRIPLAR